MTWMREQLSVLLWWLWFKVTPNTQWKHDVVDAVVLVGKGRRTKPRRRVILTPIAGTHFQLAGCSEDASDD